MSTSEGNGHARPLRLALVAPLYERVPPELYGGTERIVSYLTEALVEQGHDVTLFASGDSITAARLIEAVPRALRLASCVDPLPHHFAMLEEVYRRARAFDLVHFHVDYLHYPTSSREPIHHVTTLHGRLDLPDLVAMYRTYADVPVVSISDAQRAPLPWLAWQGTVYHGLPEQLYRLERAPGDYLAFIGRISPEKRVDRAIEIARRAGLPLRVAAKIDVVDRDYYEREIAHLMREPHVEFVGEIGEHDKQAFLGGARALVFPIDWPEPFGMVVIEALACGTPVIAFGHGSVPELLDDGATGFICRDVDEAVRAVDRVGELSREACRSEFERRFTVERMARDYVAIYRRLIDGRRDHPDRGRVLHPGHELAGG